MQALIDENWSTVGVLVSAAFRLEFKHPEVLSARDKLEYRVAVFHCGERLQAAVQVARAVLQDLAVLLFSTASASAAGCGWRR